LPPTPDLRAPPQTKKGNGHVSKGLSFSESFSTKAPAAEDATPLSRLTVSRKVLLDPGGSDQEFRQLVHDLLAFAGRIQEVRNGLARQIGLGGAAYSILISIAHLQQREASVGVACIAEHLHLSGAFVTIEVGKLVTQGLVTKETHLLDRRRVVLAVTPAGHALLDELTPFQTEVNDTLFEGLDGEAYATLREVVPQLVNGGERALALLQFMSSAEPARIARRSGT
jgi:DNA-binding MarR family transcriptional regulator